MKDVTMYSKREQRWVEAMPVPYPPTRIDWLKHLLYLHGVLIECPEGCRVYQQKRYENFEWWHNQ